MIRLNFIRTLLAVALIFQPALCFAGEMAVSMSKRDSEAGAVSTPTSKAAVLNGQPMPSAQNTCLGYTYDKNGNRTSTTTDSLTTNSAVWGASAYPCFLWTAP